MHTHRWLVATMAVVALALAWTFAPNALVGSFVQPVSYGVCVAFGFWAMTSFLRGPIQGLFSSQDQEQQAFKLKSGGCGTEECGGKFRVVDEERRAA